MCDTSPQNTENQYPQTISPLALDHILFQVISVADRKTQAACARVCREWHEPALRALWDTIDNFASMSRILQINHSKAYEPIPRNCWSKFTQIAEYIKRLTVAPPHPRAWDQSAVERILKSIAISRRSTLPIFPNLQYLSWNSNISFTYCQFLLQPGLVSLSLNVSYRNAIPDHDYLHFLESLQRRCPNLRRFELISRDKPDTPPSKVFINLFLHSSLRDVSLPAWVLSNELLSSLSQKDCMLESLRIDGLNTDRICGASTQPDEHLHNIQPFVHPDNFQFLWNVQLCTRLDTITPILSSPRLLPRLRCISLMLHPMDAYRNLKPLFKAIGENRPQFISLVIVVAFAPNESSVYQRWAIPFSDLEPLLGCQLLELVLILPWRIALSEAQLVRMANCWPNLERLHLSPCGVMESDPEGPVLPPSILPELPSLLPSLRSLGLLIVLSEGMGHVMVELNPKLLNKLENFQLGLVIMHYDLRDMAVAIASAVQPSAKMHHYFSSISYGTDIDGTIENQKLDIGKAVGYLTGLVTFFREVRMHKGVRESEARRRALEHGVDQ